jgi:hypothetical protein
MGNLDEVLSVNLLETGAVGLGLRVEWGDFG